MAKRRQTTGIPKPRRERTEDDSERQGGLSFRPMLDLGGRRSEREAQIQRLLIIGVGIAIGLVIVIIAAAFIVDQVINPQRAVASVNGSEITVSEYEDRVRLERVITIERINDFVNDLIDAGFSFEEAGNQVVQIPPYSTLWNELNTPDQMGLRVLNDMIEERIILAEAEARGITVTQEEIDEQIRQIFNFQETPPEAGPEGEATPEAEVTEEATATPTPTPTPFVSPTPSATPTETATPTAVPASGAEVTAEVTATLTPFPTVPPAPTLTFEERREQFDETIEGLYERARRDASVNREEVNRYFESQALRAKVRDAVIEPKSTGLWVNARHILLNTEDDAQNIIEALNQGESFAALAQSASTDEQTAIQGGELGWSQVDRYVEEFAGAVREAPIGEIIGPVSTQFGFHVIQVRAREERELNEAQIEQNQQQEFETWLEEQRDSEEYQVDTSDIWPNFIPTNPDFIYRPR